ncbi:MAG: type I DNA topoisomerase [Kiritimatiellia bacterium]
MSIKPKALIIVESPSKAKKIATYVGEQFIVMPSVGHIRDLPGYVLGVNVADHFTPNYVIPDDKKKIVEDLRKAAAKVPTIYLASDPDREGESIAWHLHEVLKDVKGEHTFYRVRYNEVTKGVVLNALEHPDVIDQNLVNAQQARRIEDRLSGFKISKLISSTVRGARSAGRVQSVALRLIVDRERAVREFRPTAYWLLGARLEKGMETFDARLASVEGVAPKFMAYDKEVTGIASESVAQEYLEDLRGRNVTVASVERKFVSKRPLPPFITSTLQQSAATVLGYSPDQTMRIAQALYEEGHITYMRTDGYTVSATIRGAVEAEITKLFGKECVPETPNFFGNKVKNAQEAHEPIRPTDVSKPRLDGSDPQQNKLYDLIWRRFVASQMASARFERTTMTFTPTVPPPAKHLYLFSASAQKVVFKGFLNVMELGREEAEDADAKALPALDKGDTVNCREWLCEGKETQPPARFNEASLVKALEENGIGRPSTYASTVKTLLARSYVESGKGHVLTPTEMGMAAIDYLLSAMPDFVNVEFTAQMEDALDKVADGSLDWEQKVSDFYEKLVSWLAADTVRVKQILHQLAQVDKWNDPVKTWSDLKFYTEMTEAIDKGEVLTKAQLAILIRMTITYRDQLPELESVLGSLPPPADKGKINGLFEALEGRELTEWETKFITSVKDQFGKRGDLSPKQLAMLQRIAVPEEDAERPDNEAASKVLASAFATVTEWNEAVTRGKRTFDDKEFVTSLTHQLEERHFLTERQFEALKRLVRTYQEQIPNYADLAEAYGIKTAAPRKVAAKTGDAKPATKKPAAKKPATKKPAAKKPAEKVTPKKSVKK